MLRLFQSIFGVEAEKGRYPEPLIREAIERAVDGTDPSLRGLLRYRSKLRPSVLRAIDHVVGLVEGLPDPIDASRASYGDEPLLKAFFISAEHMQKVISTAGDLSDFLRQAQPRPQRVCALLVMEKQERTTFGADLVGETVVRDVPQVTVSFTAHQLRDPSGDELQTRRLLKRRAFDHLLTLALGRISSISDLRSGLQQRRDLLEAKLNVLQRGCWGFDFPTTQKTADTAELEAELTRIEEGLLQIGSENDNLQTHLDILCEVLSRPGNYLWSGESRLVVDQMGIKREKAAGDAPELQLQEFHNAEGRSVVVSLVWLSV